MCKLPPFSVGLGETLYSDLSMPPGKPSPSCTSMTLHYPSQTLNFPPGRLMHSDLASPPPSPRHVQTNWNRKCWTLATLLTFLLMRKRWRWPRKLPVPLQWTQTRKWRSQRARWQPGLGLWSTSGRLCTVWGWAMQKWRSESVCVCLSVCLKMQWFSGLVVAEICTATQ